MFLGTVKILLKYWNFQTFFGPTTQQPTTQIDGSGKMRNPWDYFVQKSYTHVTKYEVGESKLFSDMRVHIIAY